MSESFQESPLFRPRRAPGRPVQDITIQFEGKPLRVPDGVSVAAALLMAGVADFHASVGTGAMHGPWCMMGVCFECLLEIDGRPNTQGCQTVVRAGMRVNRQSARVLVETLSCGLAVEPQA